MLIGIVSVGKPQSGNPNYVAITRTHDVRLSDLSKFLDTVQSFADVDVSLAISGMLISAVLHHNQYVFPDGSPHELNEMRSVVQDPRTRPKLLRQPAWG